MCQLQPNGIPPPPNYENPPGGCPEGWLEYHGTCYRPFGSVITGKPSNSNEKVTQANAIASCRSFGVTTNLAILPNRYHNSFVSAFLYKESDRNGIDFLNLMMNFIIFKALCSKKLRISVSYFKKIIYIPNSHFCKYPGPDEETKCIFK